VALVAAAWAPASASAESPLITMQARAANAEFLAFAPPPPGGAAAVCLVDSGVDLNPDTERNVVYRTAIDGGEPGDVRPTKHGTSMAMTMGAPVNGWGGVGAWPHVRIVSVRALSPGEEGFPFDLYERALLRCVKASEERAVATVNLSLGGTGVTVRARERLRDRIQVARLEGLNVVAAAGNSGGDVEDPAAVPEAFAVTGTDQGDVLCAFSANGPTTDIAAPGCGLDVGLPDGRPGRANGTSDSAAFVSAVLAALRSYRPDLGPDDAEALLLSTARRIEGLPVLDVEAAFRAAGLDHIVEAGRAALPGQPSPRNDTPPSALLKQPGRTPVNARPPRPRLRSVHLRGRVLTIRTSGRPRDARVRVRITYRARGEFGRGIRVIERRADTMRIRLPRRWRRIEVRFRSPGGTSPARILTPRAVSRRTSDNRRAARY
jgi:hypothetical protein